MCVCWVLWVQSEPQVEQRKKNRLSNVGKQNWILRNTIFKMKNKCRQTAWRMNFTLFFILHPNKRFPVPNSQNTINSFFFNSPNVVCLCCPNILYLDIFFITVSWFGLIALNDKNFILLQIKANDFLFHLIWTGVETRETYPRKQTEPFKLTFGICRQQLVWYLHGNDVNLIHLLHIVSSNHTLRYWMKLIIWKRFKLTCGNFSWVWYLI